MAPISLEIIKDSYSGENHQESWRPLSSPVGPSSCRDSIPYLPSVFRLHGWLTVHRTDESEVRTAHRSLSQSIEHFARLVPQSRPYLMVGQSRARLGQPSRWLVEFAAFAPQDSKFR